MTGIATVVVLIGSAGTIFGFLHPVTYAVIGDPPFASRQEVADSLSDVSKTLKQTLETAQSANQAAQRAQQTSIENRLRRLQDDRNEIKAHQLQNPTEQIWQSLLDKIDADIMKSIEEAKQQQPIK